MIKAEAHARLVPVISEEGGYSYSSRFGSVIGEFGTGQLRDLVFLVIANKQA